RAQEKVRGVAAYHVGGNRYRKRRSARTANPAAARRLLRGRAAAPRSQLYGDGRRGGIFAGRDGAENACEKQTPPASLLNRQACRSGRLVISTPWRVRWRDRSRRRPAFPASIANQ